MTPQEECKKMLELDEARIDALIKLCHANHKGGVGGSAFCVCGRPGGGTPACGALGMFLREWEYNIKPRRLKYIESLTPPFPPDVVPTGCPDWDDEPEEDEEDEDE